MKFSRPVCAAQAQCVDSSEVVPVAPSFGDPVWAILLKCCTAESDYEHLANADRQGCCSKGRATLR